MVHVGMIASFRMCHNSPEVIELFFMLNSACSAEHEIFSANKYENANIRWPFFIFISREIFMFIFV